MRTPLNAIAQSQRAPPETLPAARAMKLSFLSTSSTFEEAIHWYIEPRFTDLVHQIGQGHEPLLAAWTTNPGSRTRWTSIRLPNKPSKPFTLIFKRSILHFGEITTREKFPVARDLLVVIHDALDPLHLKLSQLQKHHAARLVQQCQDMESCSSC